MSATDGSATERSAAEPPSADDRLAGIDAPRVERWLAEHVDGLTPPARFHLVAGGRSNLTYRVTDAAGAAFALRRPPTGGVLATAHDMSREWRFLSAMAGTGVPVAPPLAYCADSTVTGAEFYVMGFVDGLVLTGPDAGLALSPEARGRAGEQLVEVLVELHALDPVAIGLGELVRRTGYVERQLRRWHAQLHASGSPDLTLLDEVHDLLAVHLPAESTGVVHGDYRPGNIAFASDGTVVAVFDWELATSGDPLADLGYLVSTWQEPGEEPWAGPPGPSTVPGFPSRADVAARYAALSGRDVSQLPYWVAFSRWRSACINAGVQARYLAGHMADDGYLEQAKARAQQATWLGESARSALRELGI